MKIAGFVCDNYKLKKYKTEFKEKGFKVISESKYSKGITTLKVEFNETELNKLKNIQNELETYFKAKRN